MADVKISDLQRLTETVGTDFFPIVSNGKTYRIFVEDFFADIPTSWDSLQNKPFNTINEEYFIVSDNTLSFSDSFINDYNSVKENANQVPNINTSINNLNNFTCLASGQQYFSNPSLYGDIRYMCGALGIQWKSDGSAIDTSISLGGSTYVAKNPVDVCDLYNIIYGSNGMIYNIMDSINDDSFGILLSSVQMDTTYKDNSYTINFPKYDIDIIGDWISEKNYKVGYFAVYDGKLYKCIEANNDADFTESKWQIISGGSGGDISFTDLANMMTGGTLENITITPNYDTQTFNISVQAVKGDKGDKGDTGQDGISPIAIVTQTESGATINITDKNGETTADISNGADGVTPHIDTSTGHWFIGETDTGVNATAGIDDTSTAGTDVTWSAYKLNSVIGDINTILASVTGVIE